ncbi:hypothetical protein BLOT_015015 [Blomia tropicalis]|nr:hypothetical protein BLOT_015015 [Blomia tropicalis]
MLNCHGSIDNLSIDVLWVTHAFVLFVECSCDILSIGQENLYEWYEGRVNQPVWSYGIETKKEKRITFFRAFSTFMNWSGRFMFVLRNLSHRN